MTPEERAVAEDRRQYARAALTGLLVGVDVAYEDAARQAFRYADAMLEEESGRAEAQRQLARTQKAAQITRLEKAGWRRSTQTAGAWINPRSSDQYELVDAIEVQDQRDKTARAEAAK